MFLNDDKEAPGPNYVLKKNAPKSAPPHEIILQTEKDYIFSINFFKNKDNIRIECSDLNSDKNILYTNILYLRNLNDLDIFSDFNNINDIFNEIKQLDCNDISLNKENNNIILNIKNDNEIILKNKNEKVGKIPQLKNIDIFKENKYLKKEKNNLEERVKNLEEYINYLKDNLPIDYINKIIISIPYNNSFDYSLYKLESVFNNLPSNSIISEKGHLGLINSGIKLIFKKNIKDCRIEFKTSNKKNDLEKFKSVLQNLENILIIVKTINDRTFGFFFINNNENINVEDNNTNIFKIYGENDNNENYNEGYNENYNEGYNENYNEDYNENYNSINPYEISRRKKQQNNITKIFNTSSYKQNSFSFSFDNNSLYSYPYQKHFSINYDNNKGCFGGTELYSNILNSTQEFIFSKIEVYEIFI